MTIRALTRRQFITSTGATFAAAAVRLPAAEPPPGRLRLGMMLQGSSAVELQQRARAIAAAGFDTVQLTFFFPPTAEELQTLATTLRGLRLSTVAFGTYFNLFQPDNTGFMHSSLATFKLVAAQADQFNCRQFVTWSASHSAQFSGAEARNHTPEAVAQLQRAVRDLILPILEPIAGRVAFEPFYPHVVGSRQLAREVLAAFPARQVGLVLDPPNLLSPDLYPQRADELQRLLDELGDRFHLAHFKDMKLNPNGQSVDYPGPGGGEMDYPRLIAGIRKLGRSLPCVIEHLEAEEAGMRKTKAWIEGMM
jgi:sugar phosphate isomerase/epimerase